jgi:hypothetical protein
MLGDLSAGSFRSYSMQHKQFLRTLTRTSDDVVHCSVFPQVTVGMQEQDGFQSHW